MKRGSQSHWPLRTWVALGTAVTTGVGLAILLLFARLQAGEWIWTDGFYLNGSQWFDAARTTVTLIGIIGLGGAAFLAYRRQLSTEAAHVLAETGALRDRYTTAAGQLADNSSAMRLAGVYALAALADDWHTFRNEDERQVCIDLLRAYLRTPQIHTGTDDHSNEQQRSGESVRSGEAILVDREVRPRDTNDDWREREVRKTILLTIHKHRILDASNLKSWSNCECSLFSADLNRLQLTAENLSNADLRGADLRGADLSEARLHSADLSNADLRGADLSGADLRGADLSEARLQSANLNTVNLSGADLSNADLSGAELIFAVLSGAYLPCADLTGADLHSANLTGAELTDADLTGAKLTVGITVMIPDGSEKREGVSLRGADLSGANLSGADLSEADLSGANLSASLARVNLSGVNLSGANLSGADLSDIFYDQQPIGWPEDLPLPPSAPSRAIV